MNNIKFVKNKWITQKTIFTSKLYSSLHTFHTCSTISILLSNYNNFACTEINIHNFLSIVLIFITLFFCLFTFSTHLNFFFRRTDILLIFPHLLYCNISLNKFHKINVNPVRRRFNFLLSLNKCLLRFFIVFFFFFLSDFEHMPKATNIAKSRKNNNNNNQT